eukprot:COSAG06_NODE_21047_length_771_cov_1.933036_1_plen_172_part_00
MPHARSGLEEPLGGGPPASTGDCSPRLSTAEDVMDTLNNPVAAQPMQKPADIPRSWEQAASAQSQRDEALAAKIAALEAKLEARAAPVEQAIKSVVAHLTETPTGWHQAVIFFLSTQADGVEEDEPKPSTAATMLMLAGAVLMVAVQCMASISLLVGAVAPSCLAFDQRSV